MLERHLTDDALLLLIGGEFGDSSKRDVFDHLEACAHCRRKYTETRDIHSAWVNLSEYGLTNLLDTRFDTRSQLRFKPAKSEFRFPWAPVSAILATFLIAIIILSAPKVVPEANASELLGHAIQTETQTDTPVRAFQISVQGTTCGIGRGEGELVRVQSSALCSQATKLIEKTPWRSRALSARTFHDWRDSLSQRHDTVIRQSSSWTIDTTTPVGIIREASLALRIQDYQTLSVRLQFENQQQITITEDVESLFYAKSAPSRTISANQVVDDPADVLEVRAWELLSQLKADSGWEANVVREEQKVVLKANVQDAARKQEFLDAFRLYPNIELDLHSISSEPIDFLAQRTLDGSAPPLASEWLKQQFPDPELRGQYANRTAELSREVLGRAFMLEQIQHRHRSLRTCSCANQLLKLIDREKTLLYVEQKELHTAISAFIGNTNAESSRPLSYEEAKRLDWALGNLLIAASQSSPSYDENIKAVQGLL